MSSKSREVVNLFSIANRAKAFSFFSVTVALRYVFTRFNVENDDADVDGATASSAASSGLAPVLARLLAAGLARPLAAGLARPLALLTRAGSQLSDGCPTETSVKPPAVSSFVPLHFFSFYVLPHPKAS